MAGKATSRIVKGSELTFLERDEFPQKQITQSAHGFQPGHLITLGTAGWELAIGGSNSPTGKRAMAVVNEIQSASIFWAIWVAGVVPFSNALTPGTELFLPQDINPGIPVAGPGPMQGDIQSVGFVLNSSEMVYRWTRGEYI